MFSQLALSSFRGKIKQVTFGRSIYALPLVRGMSVHLIGDV
jgi:hypothetical protein